MTESDLRKLDRRELLELLIASEKENSQLKEQLLQLEQELQNREIKIQKAGNLAEAAMVLNGIFETAQQTADLYLDNIRRYSMQQSEAESDEVQTAEKRARWILEQAEIEKNRRIKEADEYWDSVRERLDAFFRDHAGTKEARSSDEHMDSSDNE